MGQNVRKQPGSIRLRYGHDVLLLLAGIAAGGVGVMLYQGATSGDPDRVGAGISELIGKAPQGEPAAPTASADVEGPTRTNFDFYTVLPEIEVVIPDPKPAVESVTNVPDGPVKTESVPAVTTPAQSAPASYYMLQAGAYNTPGEAERMRARLAIAGFEPSIQHIAVQGRGDFYRVRVGPYDSMETMESANRALVGLNIKALRLKVSGRP
ncbi:MAG: SPOR domain-containing protein [Gammaproteobacteria bacterium]